MHNLMQYDINPFKSDLFSAISTEIYNDPLVNH